MTMAQVEALRVRPGIAQGITLSPQARDMWLRLKREWDAEQYVRRVHQDWGFVPGGFED